MSGLGIAPRHIRVGLAVAAVLAIGSQVIVRTFGAYLSEAMPQEALSLGLAGPQAYLAVADDLARPRTAGAGAGQTAAATGGGSGEKSSESAPPALMDTGMLEHARALARQGLRADPLSASGWRVLGGISEKLGDKTAATASMEQAARRSLRESGAHLWLLLRSYERKDAAAAMARAEILLLSRSSALQALMPALVWIAGVPDGKFELDRILAANPPWREGFFQLLPQHISDARLPLQLMLALKTSPHPVSVRDARPYLDLLMRHKLYELANYTWLQFLPPAQVAETGALFNGSFAHRPSGMPFDWIIEQGVGVSVDILSQEDLGGQKALVVEFGDGRAELKPVRQQIMLAAGAYVFKGRAKGRLVARRGLQWRVRCPDIAGEPIGKSQLITATIAKWTEFSFAFKVPAEGCRLQVVSLILDARSASEQLVQGSMSFTGLRIEKSGP